MVWSATLGLPRMGPRRELKRALEAYWSGKATEDHLQEVAKQLRARRWRLQQAAGIDRIPSNDFSLYDHVLDTAVMVGAIPPRFGQRGEGVDLSLYFELARGRHVPPLEMTKWFDTNYHYLVPEFHRGQEFHLANRKPLEEYLEAKALGIETVPILLGPVSFLLLGKSVDGSDPLDLLPSLLSVYKTLLNELAQAGAAWVQLDEPCLVMDRTDAEISALQTAYTQLVQAAPLKLLLATYFGGLDTHFDTVWQLPVQGIHLDLVRAPEQRQSLMGAEIIRGRWVSLGVLDGRNVWRADVSRIASDLRPVVERFGPERVILAPSCSLIHVPWDVELETEMDPELRGWLSFATQKLQELTALKAALQGNAESPTLFAENQAALAARKNHPRVVRPEVRERVASIVRTAAPRSDRSVRKPVQQAQLRLPVLPTTTIGSFPQTEAVRQARAKFRNGQLDADAYQAFLKEQIRACIHQQEDCGLDVLVHGEFERTDMVEYFAEHLDGFLLTRHGWVQSYGSRCVKPPILFGDVRRAVAITLTWTKFAQSLTAKPVKGMLTGPVTILQWSFVRDDLPPEEVCRQIAVAVRDEVLDLERAGIRIIQIDEPALREGLPLRRRDRLKYLKWATACFRLTFAGVRDDTQIHTHMCYAEFADVLTAIAAMDVDVISLEASRSGMDTLPVLAGAQPAYDVGPGVYDIHSPRVPSVDEIYRLLEKACEALPVDQVWVNPDCGLKTRREEEVWPALRNMVAATRQVREAVVGKCPARQ